MNFLNRRKKFSALLLIFLVFALAGQISAEFSWKTSGDGKARVWTDDSREFLWKGGVLEGFADGSGLLEFYEGGRFSGAEGATLTFGVRKADFSSSEAGLFAGEKNGTGVLLRDSGDIYAGNFRNGIPDGWGIRKNGKNIVYIGNFRQGRYDGEGELFEDEKLVYKGSFRDGRRNGKGTAFFGGFSASGNFKNDLMEGEFSVSGGGANRLVRFKGGEADLSFAEIEFDGGIRWNGAVDSGLLPKGEGILEYSDGGRYLGEVSDRMRNGWGRYEKGSLFVECEWLDDRPSGTVEAVREGSWSYCGGVEGGAFSGFGTLRSEKSGDFSYSGDWKNGSKSGWGVLWAEGSRIEGEFSSDALNGQADAEFANGDKYSGEWVWSRKEGYGEYEWADGSAYSGEWVDDLPDGEGVLSSAGGDVYSGGFAEGLYEGFGTYEFADGGRMEGIFERGFLEGEGLREFPDGSAYEGEFSGGKIEGEGKFFFADGNLYEGHFSDGRMSGRGTLFVNSEDGILAVSSTLWDGNHIPSGGSVLFPNGDEYVGPLENGVPAADGGRWVRAGEMTLSDRAYSLYKRRGDDFKGAVSKAQTALAVLSVGGTVLAAATAIPCPPVAGAAFAVSRAADVAGASLSAASIAVGTAAAAREIEDARLYGDEGEAERIKKEYLKEQAWNAADILLTAGSGGAKKATKSAAKSAAKTAGGAKKGGISLYEAARKAGGTDARKVAEAALGKGGKNLVSRHGDEAARLLSRHGKKAADALESGGEAVLAASRAGGDKAFRAAISGGAGSLSLLEMGGKRGKAASEILAKHGRSGLSMVEELGPGAGAFLDAAAGKNGEAAFRTICAAGKRGRKTLGEAIAEGGSGVLESVGRAAKEPAGVQRALRILEVSGREGLAELASGKGFLPFRASVKISSGRIKKGADALRNTAAKMESKGAIRLTKSEMEWLRKSPKENLRALVRAKTGKGFGEGFQEFFVRFSKGGGSQTGEVLAMEEAKSIVNKAIRGGGGKHEWLMTKNYGSFLTDAKWGKDGPAISLALTELTQDTRSVAFRGGGTHFDKIGSGKFHRGLSEAVDASSDLESLAKNVREYARKSLTDESFREFEAIFARVFVG